MPSTFAWLVASEHDRRRALDVIHLFRLRDTRDQLGIAGIRDAWADLLAPGTSTIQTRPRYFFFVPWIYLDESALYPPRRYVGASMGHDRLSMREGLGRDG